MKGLINLLSSPIISGFLLTIFNPFVERPPHRYGRCIIHSGALLLLIGGYILGCFALYYYLQPYWGEACALFAVCGFLLTTSLLLVAIGWLLKPKKQPPTDFMALLEKTAHHLSNDKVYSKLLPTLAPVTLLVVAAVAAYFISKKHDS